MTHNDDFGTSIANWRRFGLTLAYIGRAACRSLVAYDDLFRSRGLILREWRSNCSLVYIVYIGVYRIYQALLLASSSVAVGITFSCRHVAWFACCKRGKQIITIIAHPRERLRRVDLAANSNFARFRDADLQRGRFVSRWLPDNYPAWSNRARHRVFPVTLSTRFNANFARGFPRINSLRGDSSLSNWTQGPSLPCIAVHISPSRSCRQGDPLRSIFGDIKVTAGWNLITRTPILRGARGNETLTNAVAIKANRSRDRHADTRVPFFPRSLLPRFIARLFKYFACYIAFRHKPFHRCSASNDKNSERFIHALLSSARESRARPRLLNE